MSFNRIKHYVETIRIQSKKKYLSARLHVRILKRNGGCFHAYVWLFMNSRTKKNLSKQKYTLCCVGTLPKYNRKMAERVEIDTTNTQIHDGLFSWLGTCTSIKSRV